MPRQAERPALAAVPNEPAVTVYVREAPGEAEAALRVLDDGSLTVDVEFQHTIRVPPHDSERLARAIVHARAKRG